MSAYPIAQAQQLQTLSRQVRPAVSEHRAAVVSAMPADQQMHVSIVLPLRNSAELAELLKRLYDPASPDYRHFLSVAQFTDRFGPTTDDFQAVIDFAQANGLIVATLPANRLVVPVTGSVAQISSAFHVQMNLYQHPSESRTFFSPDREPSLNLRVPVSHISGLDSYSVPQPMHIRRPNGVKANVVNGSGPGGSYLASDMRAAYYGGSTLDGTGQAVGLLEFGGYALSDVNLTFSNAGQSYIVPINNVVLDGATGGTEIDDTEQVLDIVQAIGMAPNLSQVRVYIGEAVDDANILNLMASENIAKQISSSWSWRPADPTVDDPFFTEMAAQGQTFFAASGDAGAFDAAVSPFFYPGEDENVTAVGGTNLTTSGTAGAWASETAWNSRGSGSGGGVSPDNLAIPSWQVGLATTANGGSTLLRNVPDVAMEGDFDNYSCGNGECAEDFAGTSFAAPRWAAFMALVNQQAVESGNAPSGGLGFINTSLYRLQQGATTSADFHDITIGNNDTRNQQVWFNAGVGYDLATGLGSANGQSLIDDLAGPQVPGFWIESSASTIPVVPGGTASASFDVNDAGGFSGSVTFSVTSPLPTGVTASFSQNPSTSSSLLTLTATDTAPNASQTVSVTGTSGTLTASTNVTVAVHGPSFALAATPSVIGLAQGASATSSIAVQPLYGFSGAVSLTVAGLPAGTTASFSPSSTSGTSTLTLTTSSTATPGNATLTITGASGTLRATTTINLSVQGPSFSLASLGSVTVGQGASASSFVDVFDQYGFTGNVTFAVSGLPSGVTASFSPNPASGATTLTFSASSSAPVAQTVVTVTGTSGALSATTNITLGVFTPNFTVSSSGGVSIGQGSSATSYVYISPQYGFSSNVTLSVTGLPAGVTALWTPNPTSSNSNLTLSATSTAKVGQYNLTITGVSGTITQTVPFTLGVFTPAFTVSTYSSVTLGQGTSGTAYVSVTPEYGFTGSVKLAVSGLPSGVTGSFSPNPTTGNSSLTLVASSTATVGQYTAIITGTSGSQTATTPITVGVYTPTFTLANYGGITIGQGTSNAGYIYVNAQYGFTDSVSLTVSGLPSGVTASFSPNPTTGQSVVTLTASSTAAIGQYNLTVTGTSGSQTATTILALAVYKPTFTLSSGGSVNIGQATTATSYVGVNAQYGFTGSVNLTISGLPSGVTASFSPNPTTSSSTLTLTASSTAALGQYTLTITGTSGATTSTSTLTLGVFVPTFTLSGAYPVTVGQGSSYTEYLSVYAQYGFAAGVNLSVAGLPSGVTATLSPNPTTTNSMLTFNVGADASLGTSTVTVTGTSGSQTQTTTLQLTIASPSFTVYSSASALTLDQGASGTDYIYTSAQNGFSGNVTFTVSGLPSGVTGSFSPNPTNSQTLLTLTVGANAPPATSTLTITASSGSIVASTTLAVTVTAPGFTLAAAPAEVFLFPGGTGNTTLTPLAQNGFAGGVTYSVSGLPQGVTASFSPNPSTTSSTLTLTAAANTAPFSGSMTITGTSGSLTATTVLPVTVRPTQKASGVSLVLSSAGAPVAKVTSGVAVTMTASVVSGSSAITRGQVYFCDATTTYCDSLHQLGAAQLTSAGTASLRIIPGPGSRSYKAAFVGTNVDAPAASAASSLSVTGSQASETTIAQSGSAGDYTLTATVTGDGPVAPSGSVAFLDTTGGNSTQGSTLSSAALTGGAATFSLNTAQSPTVSNQPYNVTTADFNGDGIPDLAVSSNSYTSNVVNILLGSGDGTFTAAANLQTGGMPYSLATGDFNRDGNMDIAVVLNGSNGLNIFLGNGDGSFVASSASPATGAGPSAVAVGDYNGDGLLDLAVTNSGSQTVTVLLGNGDGTFTPAALSPQVGFSPIAIAQGDFNSDGLPDLAVANLYGGSVTILLGAGDGSFGVASTLTAGSFPDSITTADVNGDGKPDLLAVNEYSNSVTVLLGNGDGTFTPAASLNTGSYPLTIVAGDFNGDGKPDLATTSSYGSNLSLFYGNGDGSFAVGVTAVTGSNPSGVVIGDWNGDGLPDIAIANGGDNTLTVLTSQLAQTATAVASGISPVGLGQHAVDAVFSTDGVYKGSISATTMLTGEAPIITWPLPAAITYGTALSGAQLDATAAAPGSFTYSPAAGAVLPAGSQTLTVTFNPSDTTTSHAATETVALQVNQAPLSVSAANASRVYGIANPVFTGNVTGSVNGDMLAETFNTTAGLSSAPGTYPIVPAVAGTSLVNYSVTPVNGVLTITQAPTTTSLTLSNGNLTFTATVTPGTSGTPTGNVNFLSGTTVLGTGTLANGAATYVAASFPAGDLPLSAQYSGDANFTQSTSSAAAPVVLSMASASLTVGQSSSITDALTISAADGFSGTLQLSCSGLPQGATCTFAPSSVSLNASTSSAPSTLTIQTSGSARLASPSPLFGGRAVAWAMLSLPGLLLFGKRRRQLRASLQAMLLLLLVSAAAFSLSGCAGAASSSAPPTPPTPPKTSGGTYTIQVVATGTSGIVQSANLTLIVQ